VSRSFSFECPSCSNELEVDGNRQEWEGLVVSCPACRRHLRIRKQSTGDPKMTISPTTSPVSDYHIHRRSGRTPVGISSVHGSSEPERGSVRDAEDPRQKMIKIAIAKESSDITTDRRIEVECQTCGFQMHLEGSESDWVARTIVCPKCNGDIKLAFRVPVYILCSDCGIRLVLAGRTEHWIKKIVVCPKCSLGIDVAKSTRVCPFCSQSMAFASSQCPSCRKDLASGKASLLKLQPKNDEPLDNMTNYLPHGVMRQAFDRWLWHKMGERVRSFLMLFRIIRTLAVFIIAVVVVVMFWQELKTVTSVIIGGFGSLLSGFADVLREFNNHTSGR